MKYLTALLLISLHAHAGEFGTLTCKACNFSKQIMTGGTRHDAQQGLTRKAFFCKQTKSLIQLAVRFESDLTGARANTSPRATDGPVATRTSALVSPKSKFNIFTSTECPNGLIPVDYYLEDPSLPCPICGKGSVEYKGEGFAD